MTYLIFKIVHLAGIMCLFASLGGLMAADHRKPATLRGFTALHGIGLLILFITGFGMQGTGKLGFPLWLILKIVIFFLLGASLVIFKRRLIPTKIAMTVVILLGTLAGYLAILRPFQ